MPKVSNVNESRTRAVLMAGVRLRVSGGLPDLRKVARHCMPLLALWKRRAQFQILTALISSVRFDFSLLLLDVAVIISQCDACSSAKGCLFMFAFSVSPGDLLVYRKIT
jgi:hypothetical protein